MITSVMERLVRARSLAWWKLQPAFDWAIHEAEQAEYEATRSSVLGMTNVEPVYSPIVLLLANSVEETY